LVLAGLIRVRGGRYLAGRVVLVYCAAVSGTRRHRPAERVVGPGVSVDLGPGRVLHMLPFREPNGGVVQGGGRRDDQRPGQIGRPEDAGTFCRQVAGEIDRLGGHETGRPLLLQGDMCQFTLRDICKDSQEITRSIAIKTVKASLIDL